MISFQLPKVSRIVRKQQEFLYTFWKSPTIVEWQLGEQDIALEQRNSNGDTLACPHSSCVEKLIFQRILILLAKPNLRAPLLPPGGRAAGANPTRLVIAHARACVPSFERSAVCQRRSQKVQKISICTEIRNTSLVVFRRW